MPENTKYERPEMLDIKVFTVLTLSFIVWDATFAYMGLASLTLGLNAVAMSSPRIHVEIDRLIYSVEDMISPIVQEESWRRFRSLVYLLLVTGLSASSYLAVVLI